MPTETLPPTVYIAAGVIAAALISAFWSLISLIIAKDQKISEFRQAWIDQLRKEISSYNGQLLALSTSWLCFSKTEKSAERGRIFLQKNLERFAEIESKRTSILLRMNPDEHEEIVASLDSIETIICDPERLPSDEFTKECEKLLCLSQKLLKSEWERVKKGEKTFRWLRNISFGIVVVAGAGFLYTIYA